MKTPNAINSAVGALKLVPMYLNHPTVISRATLIGASAEAVELLEALPVMLQQEFGIEPKKSISLERDVLKEGSPSCGTQQIYDGSFSGQKISGSGVCAEALRLAGLRLFNENQLAEAAHLIDLIPGKGTGAERFAPSGR